MKKIIPLFLMAVSLAACQNDNKVTIKGSFSQQKEGTVYLDQSEVDRNTLIDSAKLRNGRFRFTREITGPEFYQVRLGKDDFVSLIAMPGDVINLSLNSSPLVMNYTVTGSAESEKIRGLDRRLYETHAGLDSLRKEYAALTPEELESKGPALQKDFMDIIEAQRKSNIAFILENLSSLSSIKALYQRIDENAYVLYHPRDLQFLKIVADTLSVRYPASRHVIALRENVTRELNRMYIDRLASIAAEAPAKPNDPSLPDTDGNIVSLSSLRGKYVLVSFWSTTSEACLTQLQELKNIYNAYHSKGLEIYHVSLDADAERWKRVVAYEGIPWISVREQDPLNPVYARAMNIQEVPANLLYDPSGNIINSNLFGRNLQIRMDQLFNKQ